MNYNTLSNVLPQLATLLGKPLPAQDKPRKVYANRNLRLDSIELVGFDMDYTLALYQQDAMEQLSIDCTVSKLIARGYPKEIADLKTDPRFGVRGLVVDKEHGNLLKMDRHHFVGHAYHGMRELSSEERRALYSEVRVDIALPRYACIDTLFALPEARMYASLIDFFQKRKEKISYEKLWDEIRDSIDQAHRDDSIKRVILADVPKYIVHDPELPLCLHKLRSTGKKLFLLTNSYWTYTDKLMHYLLDGAMSSYPTWQSYFDYIIVGAQKPVFFTGQQPFLLLDEEGNSRGEALGAIERGKFYQGGNVPAFERSLKIKGDRVLYIGDHIYGDILRSKKTSNWRTAMIIQEMEDELLVTEKRAQKRDEITALENKRDHLDHEINYRTSLLNSFPKFAEEHTTLSEETLENLRLELKLEIDNIRRQQREVIDRLDQSFRDYERQLNPYWGSIFKDGNENSRFGEQVDDYACVYTSRVSNFLYYSPMHYFVAPPEQMPHEREVPVPTIHPALAHHEPALLETPVEQVTQITEDELAQDGWLR